MALEDFSCLKSDAMQVSGSYTAIGSIFGVQQAQRTRRASALSAGSPGDTVSISEEALVAYRKSVQQGVPANNEEAQDAGAKFRKALEKAWNRSEETSLSGGFLSAISFWKRQPQDASALQEKVPALQDNVIDPVRAQGSAVARRFRKQAQKASPDA